MERRKLHAGRIDRLPFRPGVGLLRRALGVISRVRKRQDHGTLVDAGHALDDLLVEKAANGADADDRGRLDALDGSNEIPSRRMPVRIRLLEVEKVLSAV